MKAFTFLFLIHISGLFFLLPGDGIAQDTGSGLDFLNISPSASMLAIGESTAATPTGPSVIYSNPSLLSSEKGSGFEVNYTLWVNSVNNQFAAVHLKKQNLTYAFGIYSSRSDDFEARNRPGPSAGSFSISYLSISTAAAYRFGPLSLGITGQYLREEIFQLRANGYAFNTGASLKMFQDRILAGISLNNMGKMEKLDLVASPLPTMLKAGVSAQLIRFVTPGQNDLPVLVVLHTDWSHYMEDTFSGDYIEDDANDDFLSLGLSAVIADLLTLRGAYRKGPTERPVSFGFGVNIKPVEFNYALVPFSTGYGTVHSFGLQYKF